jgi:hypothetical protein
MVEIKTNENILEPYFYPKTPIVKVAKIVLFDP